MRQGNNSKQHWVVGLVIVAVVIIGAFAFGRFTSQSERQPVDQLTVMRTLAGSWIDNEHNRTLSFTSNGLYTYKGENRSGNYQVAGNQLILQGDQTYNYTLEGDLLTLTGSNGVFRYTRFTGR